MTRAGRQAQGACKASHPVQSLQLHLAPPLAPAAATSQPANQLTFWPVRRELTVARAGWPAATAAFSASCTVSCNEQREEGQERYVGDYVRQPAGYAHTQRA